MQVAGTYIVVHWQVVDGWMAYGSVYMCACICIYISVCMSMHMYRLATNNKEAAVDQTAWHSGR